MAFTNKYKTRAEWADCDPLEQVFYPNYFRLFDTGTHRLLKAVGAPYEEIIVRYGLAGLPLVDAQASFKGRCRWTDELEVESYISEFSNKTFTVAHNIWNGDNIAVEGREVRIWGLFDTDDDTKLKAGVIPRDFKKMFA